MQKIPVEAVSSRQSFLCTSIYFLFLQKSVRHISNQKGNWKEIYVLSAENLSAEEDELKKICQRFSGSTRSLTCLREKLSVKDFVKMLNSFPAFRKSQLIGDAVKSDKELPTELGGIVIHFEHCDSKISLENSNDTSSPVKSVVSSMNTSEVSLTESSETSSAISSETSSATSSEMSSAISSVTSVSDHKCQGYQSLDLLTETTSENEGFDDDWNNFSSDDESDKFYPKEGSLTLLSNVEGNSQSMVEESRNEEIHPKRNQDFTSENSKRNELSKFTKICNSQNLLFVSFVILSTMLVVKLCSLKLK